MNLNATLFGQAIAFVLFVLFCMKYVWPPLMAAIEARQQAIAESLSAVAEAKKVLTVTQSEVSAQLNKANIQAHDIVAYAHKQSAQLIEEAKTKAMQERTKILLHAGVEAEAVCNRERELLRQQFGQLVVLAAEKLIAASINNSVSQEIVEQLVAEL